MAEEGDWRFPSGIVVPVAWIDNRRHFVAVAACARGRLGRHRCHDRGRPLRLRLRRRLRRQQLPTTVLRRRLPTTVLRRRPPQCLGDAAEADDDDGGRRRRPTAAIMESTRRATTIVA